VSEHSPTPWKASQLFGDELGIDDADGDEVTGFMDAADARRIVACVNACDGLPQDALDGGWTALGLSKHAKALEKQRDQLLAALDDLVQFFDEDELLLAADVRGRLRPIAERARKHVAAAKGGAV
jgi:hypothetical protein